MRLIDADALMDRIESETGWGEDYNAMQILGAIEDQPTIEAIPVKFIIKKSRKLIMSGQFDPAIQLDSLIDDWMVERKEE